MTLEEKTTLLLEVTRLLYEHSPPTDDTLDAVPRLAASLGVSVVLNVRWGEVHIEVQDERGTASRTILAAPREGRAAPRDARAEIKRPSPIPLPLFILTSAGAAGSLATIFGADASAILLASAGAGVTGLLRRIISLHSSNALLQRFAAAVFAGLVGAAASHFHLSRTTCHRHPSPAATRSILRRQWLPQTQADRWRVECAGTTSLRGRSGNGDRAQGPYIGRRPRSSASLPVTEMTGGIPLLRDAIAAAIATASFGALFAIPGNVLVWTVGIAIAAHMARWLMMNVGAGGFGSESLVACALAGTLATLVARRHLAPFAAVAFAAVVSMLPGIFMFRDATGMIEILNRQTTAPQVLIAGTLADSARATVVTLAMGIGLMTPRHLLVAWGRIRTCIPVQSAAEG